jgi:UDP-N-acetylmuramoyl-L-alanyl-D-glutamate--2,6-diaminopimelate ligase
MKFLQLLRLLKVETKTSEDFEVTGVSSDSRAVKKGDIFVAIEGYKKDGISFAKEAIARGARVIIYDKTKKIEKDLNIVVLPVDCPRKVLSLVSSLVYRILPTLKIVAITGTNGKTTTTYLCEHILKNQGYEVGTVGTINYRYKGRSIEALNTTPEPVTLCKILSQMSRENVRFALLEVSSHALSQARVDNINFEHAIFTNLSSEHLDFHKSLENYFTVKSRLFTELKPTGYSIINVDDKFGQRLVKISQSRILTYGLSKNSDIRAEKISLGLEGTSFDLWIKDKRIPIKTRLIGRHNVYNILSAVAVAYLEGVNLEVIRKSIFSFEGVPGRLQKIDCGQPYFIYIDYAHTPQALESALESLKGLVKRRIITVFGCGGNRDRRKRPLMGEVASRLSDIIVLTEDNPRDEDSYSIISQIVSGIKTKSKLEIELDRKRAIEKALSLAQAGDCVLIAGKGHENYQIIKDKRIKFNDADTVRDLLKK